MRFFLLSMIVLGAWACSNQTTGSETHTLKPSHHTAAFNSTAQQAMHQYYRLTEAFIDWDSTGIAAQSAALAARLDSLQLDSLTNAGARAALDSSKVVAKQIAQPAEILSRRHLLSDLTQHVYSFLNQAHYDDAKVYFNKCPMAYNDAGNGFWLSAKNEIRNPYMGLHHPTYGKGMMECGSTEDSVNFISGR